MWPIDVGNSSKNVMDAVGLYVVAVVVLIQYRNRPMRTPGVFRQQCGPVSFVLKQFGIVLIVTHPHALDFCPQTLFWLDPNLRF